MNLACVQISMPHTTALYRKLESTKIPALVALRDELRVKSKVHATNTAGTRLNDEKILPHHVRFARLMVGSGTPFTIARNKLFRE